jgi:oligopeptide/dipeptide ABC transporter ATP-binding protein
MESIPKLELKEKRLKSLKGMVPSILAMGEGCKLCSRFDPADCACKGTKEEPDLIEVSNNHWARVHPEIIS